MPDLHHPFLSTASGGAREDKMWHGVYDAQIGNTADPLNQGRVRLFVPQVLGNTLSNWAPAMQPAIATPAVGTNVFAVFLGGNPVLPYYFFGLTPGYVQAISPNTGLVLNSNPYFIGGVITGWSATNGTLTAIQPNPDTNPPFVYGALLTSSGAGGSTVTEVGAPFLAGSAQPYQVSAWVFYPAGGTVRLGLGWSNAQGVAQMPSSATFTVPANTWTLLQSVQNSPTGAAKGYPFVGPVTSTPGQQLTVEAVQVIGQIPGSLIQAGTITATQVANSTLTAAQIAANTITGGNILVGTIQGVNIGPNTITASNLIANIVVAGIVDGTTVGSANFLEYQGAPALGTLVGSWSATGGTDSFGNAYGTGLALSVPQQIQFTGPDGSVMSLIPAANEQITLTQTLSGIYQTALQQATTDINQVVPSHLASVLLNPGAASQQMASFWHSPNQGLGTGIFLISQSDDNTIAPTILLCRVTSANNVDTITPIACFQPFAFILYSGSSGWVVVTKTSGSGTIPIPGGTTTAKGEAWGSGSPGAIGGSNGGIGGPGGEYAAETALVVTSGGTVSYAVGTNGGDTTLNNGLGTIVTAHGGNVNGTGSGNTIHFHGGLGGVNGVRGGGGGGSSAGTGAIGNPGLAGGNSAGGAGGVAPAGGGSGGRGGNIGVAGSNGLFPGGGGGGGGQAHAGGSGANGQVRLTYNTGNPGILFSVAATAGTDPFGTAFSANINTSFTMTVNNVLMNTLFMSNQTTPGLLAGTTTMWSDTAGMPRFLTSLNGDTNAYSMGHVLKRSNNNTLINSTSTIQIDNLSFTVGIGDYHVHGVIIGVNGASGVLQPQGIRFEGTATMTDMRVLVRSAQFAINSVDAVGNITAMNADPDNNRTPALNEAFTIEFDGWISVSAAGTFQVHGRELTTSADVSWTAQKDSYCGLWPSI